MFFAYFTFIIHRGFSKWYLLDGALSQLNIESEDTDRIQRISLKCLLFFENVMNHDNSFDFDFSSSDISSSSNGKTSLIVTGFAKVSNPKHKPIDIKIVKIYAFKRLPDMYLMFSQRIHQMSLNTSCQPFLLL